MRDSIPHVRDHSFRSAPSEPLNLEVLPMAVYGTPVGYAVPVNSNKTVNPCHDSRKFSIHAIEALIDGTKMPVDALNFKTCDTMDNSVNKMLVRAKYLSSIISVNSLKWNTNFERSRKDTLDDLVVNEVVKGVEYLCTSDDHYIHVLPNDVEEKELTANILQRMQDCGVFNQNKECRYKSSELDTQMNDNKHATVLSKHLRIQQILQDHNLLPDEFKLNIDSDINVKTDQSLNDVLPAWTDKNSKRLIDNPFQCWFRVKDGLYRVNPKEIRLNSRHKKTCEQPFKYSQPYFYCSSVNFTRFMPYKPVIGLYVDDEMKNIKTYLLKTIRNAAEKNGLKSTETKDVTHELLIQYFNGRTNDENYTMLGSALNPEENGTVHRVLESVLHHEIWCMEMCPPVGLSLYDILLDPKSPAFREDVRTEILQKNPMNMSGTSEDEIITTLIDGFANFVNATKGLIRQGSSFEAWDVKKAFDMMNTIVREKLFPGVSVDVISDVLKWLDDVPDTIHIPLRNPFTNGFLTDRAVYRGSIRRRAYSTQTQCCLNLERTTSFCTLKGYDETSHKLIVQAFQDPEYTNLTIEKNTVHVRAYKRYADLENVVKTLTANGMTLDKDSLYSLVIHKPRIIPDEVPSNTSMSVTGLWGNMRRMHETEREFAVRAASIHPDMICFNITVNSATNIRAKKMLNDIFSAKALGIWDSGTWEEKLGFGSIFVKVIDAFIQVITKLNPFGDGNEYSLIQTVVQWMMDLFDYIVDAFQKDTADSYWQYFQHGADDDSTGEGMLGSTFSNVIHMSHNTSPDENPVDGRLNDMLEAVQATVHTQYAVQDPLGFIMNILKQDPGFDTWGASIYETVQEILVVFVNPLQVLFLVPKLQRIAINMYNTWDRKRLQHNRQHTLTYASFVRHLSLNRDIVALVQRDRKEIVEPEKKPASIVLGARMTKELVTWSKSSPMILTHTYYRDGPQKCYIHERPRCSECSKETIGFDDAVYNVAGTLRRFAESGILQEDLESEVVRLRERVRELEGT